MSARVLCICLFAALLFISTTFADLVIYDGKQGKLVNNWENWSWANVSLTSTDFVAPGDMYSISVVIFNYQALSLHTTTAITTREYKALTFLVNGGTTGAQPVNLQAVSGSNGVGKILSLSSYTTLPVGKWMQVNVPLSDFGLPASTIINGVFFQAATADKSGVIYLDDVFLISAPPPPITPVTVTVNITKNRRLFSNLIFGVNFASAAQINTNKYTCNRWGGESMTRYAWDIDAVNLASDWFFEDLPRDTPDPSTLPFNSTADLFVRDSLTSNALPVITVPILGYVPFDRVKRCGFSVKKYGPQQSTDVYLPDCGNGVKPDGSKITGNDVADTSRIVDESFILKWIAHLDQAFGNGKVFNFELDNEPALWNLIHRDVHPQPIGYDELWTKTVQYAGAIRKAYPNAKIYGPIPWGWCEYMYSALDNCAEGPDRKAHGDVPLLEWYIQQVANYKAKYNVTLIDVIDIHGYPNPSDVALSNNESPAIAAIRFRSTKSLWDPSYIDESWVAQPVYILPRVQQWIDKYVPGLQIAVSEYNWGNDDIITGALAQVMVLGIFSQQNVYLATRWIVPDSNTKTEQSFKLYTNYDGKGSAVKGDSVSATSNNDDDVSAYGFYDSGKVYTVLVNKRSDGAIPITVDVTSAALSSGKASIYSFSQTENINLKGAVNIVQGKFTVSLGAWSAALAVASSA